MRITKDYIDRFVEVIWLDPSTYTRVELSSVKLSECNSNGKVVEVRPNLILCHDTCSELGDYTIIPPSLIESITIV